MTKYYVESGGQLRVVVLARNPIEAILKSMSCSATDAPLPLADVFIVNQRGFVWDRPNHEMYGDEKTYPTRLLLGQPDSNA